MGLREEKKQATRRHLSDIASGLFLQRGFDNVTVAEVAEAAGVSKMTVFNYFPRKEDLFLDRHVERLAGIEEALRTRAPGESPAAALRRYQLRLLAERHPLAGTKPGSKHFLRVVEASPALRNRALEQAQEVVDVIESVLAEELDALDARLTAALLATTLDSITRNVSTRMLAGDDPGEVHRGQAAVVERAFALVENGVAMGG